jgi:preprotein translocase subunit YajC
LPQLLFTLVLVAIGWVLIIRPQQAQIRERRAQIQAHDAMVAALEPGQKIITAGGIHGTVVAVADETVRVEVARDIELTLARDAIHRRIDEPADQDPSVENPVTPAPTDADARSVDGRP